MATTYTRPAGMAPDAMALSLGLATTATLLHVRLRP
jgi:hypothetical protein